ncbi:MAG: hypothetical protein ABI680_10055 [Chthoniobacteraceae bacterium]
MPTALFPSATIAEVYRFALLLTGDLRVAGDVVAESLHATLGELTEIRSEKNRLACLLQRLRDRCAHTDAPAGPLAPRLVRTPLEPGQAREILPIEAFIVARHFSLLPEPARSALALFYLEIFGPEEIAKILKLSLDQLGVVLGEGRSQLEAALEVAGP